VLPVLCKLEANNLKQEFGSTSLLSITFDGSKRLREEMECVLARFVDECGHLQLRCGHAALL